MLKKKLYQSGLNLTAYDFFHRMISWLECNFTCTGLLNRAHWLLDKFFRILRTRGKTQAIKYCKELRGSLIKTISQCSYQMLLSKDQLENISFHRDLKFLKKYIPTKGYPLIRLILSTLYISRILRGDGIPSFSSIELGPEFSGTPDSLKKMMKPFLSRLGLNPNYFGSKSRQLNFKDFHMTSKSGPNGHALWSSYKDLKVLKSSKIYESLVYLGGESFGKHMSNYLELIPYIEDILRSRDEKSSTNLRKLSVIRDKEGKNREVAILDYYSQAALKPLHEYQFKILKNIPQDRTFSQDKDIHSFRPTVGSSYHSIDLSNATDRFPIEIQKDLLSILFGEEYSKHWKNIMVGLPFNYQEREIIYARGNPMGALSSWSSFTLAHHFLVYAACERASTNWKRCPYILLGDDIVIANDSVAKEYMNILESLEIPFSKEKSHCSPYMFEFAKRFIHEGEEITPFPLAGLFENRNNWLLAIGTIYEETYRKRWITSLSISSICDSYLSHIGFNSSYRKKKIPYIELTLKLRDFLTLNKPLAPAIEHAALLVDGNEFLQNLKYLGMSIYERTFILEALFNTFKESFKRVTGKSDWDKPWLLAEEFSMVPYSLLDKVEDPFMLMQSCPIIRVYSQFEDLYLKLKNNPYNDSAIETGKLRKYLIQVSIPVSDKTFHMRRKDVIMTATSKLADQLLRVMSNYKNNLAMGHPMAW